MRVALFSWSFEWLLYCHLGASKVTYLSERCQASAGVAWVDQLPVGTRCDKLVASEERSAGCQQGIMYRQGPILAIVSCIPADLC